MAPDDGQEIPGSNGKAKRNKDEENQPEAQLPADDFRVGVVPLVIADGPPPAGMVELHAALVRAAPACEAQDGGGGACAWEIRQ